MLGSVVLLFPFPLLVCQMIMMYLNFENHNVDENNVRIKPPKIVRKKDQDKRSNKCNQCDFASSYASNLRAHLKRHSGKKSNKCNQCNFESSQVSNLRTHLKTHSGEKPNKCNQCDFASSQVHYGYI